jgi:hypothetical protein
MLKSSRLHKLAKNRILVLEMEEGGVFMALVCYAV